MADVTDAFLRGTMAGHAVREHNQQLEENKLRAMVLKHQLQALKVEDALRARDIALQNASILEGTPESEIQPEPGVSTAPPGSLAPGVALPEAPKRLAPVTIPGVSSPELGINIPPVQHRPRTLEELTRAAIAAKLREPVKLGQGETLALPLTGEVLATGQPRLQPVGRGGLANPSTGEVVVPGTPPAAPRFQSKNVLLDGKPATVNYNPGTGEYQVNGAAISGDRVKPIPPASSGTAPGVKEDADEIAAGIIDGTQPPDLTGLSRGGAAIKVRAALHRQKFDLVQATSDWKATQKYLSTLEGPQQVRLRQAVTFTRESLEPIRSLAAEWDNARILKGGKLVPLNKLELDAAVNGAYGEKAASIATRLQSQINDVVSELATVYKGGNSPTDEGLKLAASNLKGQWSKKVLLDNLDQVEKNLGYRSNSIKLFDLGGGVGTRYAPTGDTGRGGGPGAGGGITVTDPSGGVHTFKTQADADAFKKAAGIR